MSRTSEVSATSQSVDVVDLPQQAGFNILQCAAYTGLSAWGVRMAIWKGHLPARKVGRSLLILRRDIDEFLETLPKVDPLQSSWLAARQGGAK